MTLTKAEWLVMNTLWRIAPATAREILQDLPEGTTWAYTTVKTILSRLELKGGVRSAMVGRSAQYQPLLSRRAARGSAISDLLARVFQGNVTPLMQFLVEEHDLSDRERRELAALLAAEEEKGGTR